MSPQTIRSRGPWWTRRVRFGEHSVAAAALLFGVLVCFTRWPLTPGQLYAFDNFNFAYAIGHFDIAQSQPQPPGYPVFVVLMHALAVLRFKRPESILFALRILGSIASCVALFWTGRRMFGARVAWIATLLLSVQPAFWFAGLTSSIRIQLALISALVGGCCWRAWQGSARAAAAGGILLGIGSGIRPELGPLLLPLWAAGVWRAERTWMGRLRQGLLLLLCVLAWLAPTVTISGGPARYWQVNWSYLKLVAGETSGLFGASERLWETTLVWLAVWAFSILLALPLPAILAWNRGFGLGRERRLFLLTWLLPPLAFAAGVHAAAPGHVLAMLPPVCLGSAHLMEQAAERLRSRNSPFLLPVLVVFPALLMWLGYTRRPEMVPWAIAVGGAAIGVLWLVPGAVNSKWMPRWQASALIAAPAIVLSLQIFFQKNWYFAATDASPAVTRIRRDIHSGFRQMSYPLVLQITDRDDHLLRDIIALARERTGAVALWDRGPIEWRKLSYYAPWLPVIVIARDSARVALGPDVGSAGKQVRLSAPPRLILLTNTIPPGFKNIERRGAQAYIDPPANQHEAHLGEIQLLW